MKLASFKSKKHAPSFGIVTNTGIIDLAPRLSLPTLADTLNGGQLGKLDRIAAYPTDFAFADIDWLPVIPEPRHLYCIGVNYADHLQEVRSAGVPRPQTTRPPLFVRFPETVVGHEKPIVHPGVSKQFDYEAELAVIIGKPGRYIEKSDALSHVAGYSCFNDGSARDWQFHTTQIIPGKNFFQTASFGPWLVTPDEIGNAANLSIKFQLNGIELQNGNTRDMIYDVAACISYISAFMPLYPGDVIATGTPAGVGLGRTPQVFLKAGDVCEVIIENIGTLRNEVIGEPSRRHWAN
jgi:2-keto-4-pentenoate hydratase/2-oxohepta-3-ene-1,7-dioic acid hydratase in catechol pathway